MSSDIKQFSKFGFIGIGAMGSGMAKNLLKQKKELIIFDLNSKATEKLSKDGAQIAGSVKELVMAADCIITMLPADKDVLEVYTGREGIFRYIKKSSLLIDSSTVDPNVSEKLSAIAREKEVTFIDAPVSGGVPRAESAQLTFMFGGTKEEAELCRPILGIMGKNIIHCGPCGSGQKAKICNNLLLGITMVGASEAINLGKRLGLDPSMLRSVINTSSGRCYFSEAYDPIPDILERGSSNNNSEVNFAPNLLAKDLAIAKSLAERNGGQVLIGELALKVFKSICESEESQQ